MLIANSNERNDLKAKPILHTVHSLFDQNGNHVHTEIAIGIFSPTWRGLVVVVLGASHPLGALGAVHIKLLLGVREVPPVAPLRGELGAVLHLGHGSELPSCLVPE